MPSDNPIDAVKIAAEACSVDVDILETIRDTLFVWEPECTDPFEKLLSTVAEQAATIERLEGVVGKLPKTADGVATCWIGSEVWLPAGGLATFPSLRTVIGVRDNVLELGGYGWTETFVYSTEQAALAAAGQKAEATP